MDDAKVLIAMIVGIVGAASGMASLIMHYRTAKIDKGILSVSAKLNNGFQTDQMKLEISLVNKGRRIVRVHSLGIRHRTNKITRRTSEGKDIPVEVRGRTTYSIINDDDPVFLEEAEKKIISVSVNDVMASKLEAEGSVIVLSDSLGNTYTAKVA